MDRLQVGIYGGVVCIIGFFIASYFILRENFGSRSLALGIGSVAAALVLFIIQLFFELQRTITRDHFSTQYTVDRQELSVRQPSYSVKDLPVSTLALVRPIVDIEASKWLREHNPQAFHQDRDKLITDLVIFNLLAFISTAEFDWQLRRIKYATRGVGDVSSIDRPESKPDECSVVKNTELRAKLNSAGNLFSEASLGLSSRDLCLPPQSTVHIAATSLRLRNPICEISFTVEPILWRNFVDLGPDHRIEIPRLSNGEPRLETRQVGIGVEVVYFALRAQHREKDKYREWCSRLINDASEWFQLNQAAPQ